jgi:glycosyltransferase involved in cell wall biosynthesis
MRKYSVIIPIYNRPEELDELLESLKLQTYTDFEIIIVEDGSELSSEQIAKKFAHVLHIQYFSKKNEGQGFARNYGAEYAKGEFLVFFDSDVIVPPKYFETVELFLQKNNIEAFGGEDKASVDFSVFQKALSYAMTSILTTGGIRNTNKNIGGSYQIRSYNCGIKLALFKKIGGFKKTNMGEDMELNNRLEKIGTIKCLIPHAGVYHKRRGNFKSFYQQVFSFGQTRVQLKKRFGIPIKLVHLFPVSFVIYTVIACFLIFTSNPYSLVPILLIVFYFSVILVHASISSKNLKIGILSVMASFIQQVAYGLGFLKEVFFPMKKIDPN